MISPLSVTQYGYKDKLDQTRQQGNINLLEHIKLGNKEHKPVRTYHIHVQLNNTGNVFYIFHKMNEMCYIQVTVLFILPS